jgi:predicted TPR repeat methyltransferase
VVVSVLLSAKRAVALGGVLQADIDQADCRRIADRASRRPKRNRVISAGDRLPSMRRLKRIRFSASSHLVEEGRFPFSCSEASSREHFWAPCLLRAFQDADRVQ